MKNEENKPKKRYLQDLCSGFIHIIFAALFCAFVNDSSHYNYCTTNSSIYRWGYTAFLFHIVATGCSFLLFPFLLFIFINYCPKSNNLLLLIQFFRTLCWLGNITCFAGICYSYGEKENCFDSDLRKLALAYIIICSVGLMFVGIIVCCSICGGLYLCFMAIFSKDKSQKQEDGLDIQTKKTNI
jgi:hypothetical protein